MFITRSFTNSREKAGQRRRVKDPPPEAGPSLARTECSEEGTAARSPAARQAGDERVEERASQRPMRAGEVLAGLLPRDGRE